MKDLKRGPFALSLSLKAQTHRILDHLVSVDWRTWTCHLLVCRLDGYMSALLRENKHISTQLHRMGQLKINCRSWLQKHNFQYHDNGEYPHMNDLRKLSSSLMYCPILLFYISLTILNYLSLSLCPRAWLAHCIPYCHLNQMFVNTMGTRLKDGREMSLSPF